MSNTKKPVTLQDLANSSKAVTTGDAEEIKIKLGFDFVDTDEELLKDVYSRFLKQQGIEEE